MAVVFAVKDESVPTVREGSWSAVAAATRTLRRDSPHRDAFGWESDTERVLACDVAAACIIGLSLRR